MEHKGTKLDCGYKFDVVAAGAVLLERKSVEHLLPARQAQVITSLKLSNLRIGLLINFNVPRLKEGIRRIVR